MLFGCSVVLMAAGFLTEVPPTLQALLVPTNEIRGTFVQTKTVQATARTAERTFETRGTYRLVPGASFEWKTREPFETCFSATPTNYVYANEDETVTRRLADLPGYAHYADLVARRDLSQLFKAFDALYKEDSGRFYLKAKPKVGKLQRLLSRVELEGVSTNWFLRAEFPNGDVFRIDFTPEKFRPRGLSPH